jgi:hypothetical protein
MLRHHARPVRLSACVWIYIGSRECRVVQNEAMRAFWASYIVFRDLYSEVLRFRTYPQEDPAPGRHGTGLDHACGSSELQKSAVR